MTEDLELLRCYATEKSEAAFAELTKRNVDLVYWAGLRLVRGDVPAAQDVTQQVFAEAARQAKRLAGHPALVGWLYTTTRLMALRAIRTEQRRKAREQEAQTMNELLEDQEGEPDWNRLGPLLEGAMHELEERDRHAVLLRFFQNKTLAEVGRALDLNENAARMRVERAVEKLRGKLARRGVTTTAAALAAAVSANAVQAAPAAFAASLSGAALAASAVPAATLATTIKTLAMTTLQKTVVAAALAAAVGTGLYAVHHSSQLNARLEALRQEQAPLTARIQQLEQERSQTSAQVAALSEENARLKSGRNQNEVLKLRGEVGTLRKQAAVKDAKAGDTSTGMARLIKDPSMQDYLRHAMIDKFRSMYGDLIKELKLTPEQTDQLMGVLADTAKQHLAQLTAAGQGKQAEPDSGQDTANQFRAILGDAGCVRFGQYSDELPGRATVALLNSQSGVPPLTEDQTANLIRVIKAEPADLTRGLAGSPDKAFMGSQADIDNFLGQVAQSNQRIVQQAGGFLAPEQVTALDSVLTKGIETRRLQGSAFFPKH